MSIVDDLALKLSTAYGSAKQDEKVVQIHLFGIANANFLSSVSLPDLLARADMPDSSKTELRKGMRLARFVAVQ